MATTSNLAQPLYLTNHTSLLQTFNSFLTVSIHTLLYARSLYPATTFLSTRAYNLPVHQSRHPSVCAWISSAVSAVSNQLTLGVVRNVIFVVYNTQNEVMERWVFNVETFPVVEKSDALVEFEDNGEGFGKGVNRIDLEEQLRAVIGKLVYVGDKLGKLPKGCTFTVVVELREGADVPIRHPQPWIPSSPEEQVRGKGDSQKIGKELGGVQSTPVRAVEAGVFSMEAWVEEGSAKMEFLLRGQSEAENN